MEELDHNILKVLSYFDVFNYPLVEQEIHYFLALEIPPEDLPPALNHLTDTGIIFYLEGFYSLHNDIGLIKKRLSENKRAETLLPKAKWISRLLYHFPFVRTIGISGSLSKNVADPNSDFDFFIVTQTNRLWITRSIFVLLSRASALLGKRDWFCLNYYIDESSLRIPEQNIYIATEIITLIFTKYNETSHFFLESNSWVIRYYPNFRQKKSALTHKEPGTLLKKVLEAMLNLVFIDKLDSWLMTLTANHLKRKKEVGKLVSLHGKELALPLIGKHYCKHDPDYFQAEVLNAHAEKMGHLLNRYHSLQQQP
jgi:hypothetical protein